MNLSFPDPVARINQFTAGKDRSDTLQMRDAAKEYARRCTELNQLLDELQGLLDHGRSREALARAAARQPSLAEQAEALHLADPQIFLDAAADYGWELPPSLATNVLQQLAAVAVEMPRLQPLLAQWRGVARSTDDGAKIAILRQLVHADPAHAREWKENLLTVEQRYTAQLLEKAQNRDLPLAELQSLAVELLSPQLCQPLPADRLQPILNRLRVLQAEERNRRAMQLLDRIAAADGAADFSALEQTLQEYDRLAGDPDFTAPPEAEAQLEIARNALAAHQAETAAIAAVTTLTHALEEALDRQQPASEVERLFRKLRTQTEQVPTGLADRVADYLETVRFREERRHFRILFIAGAAAILLIVLGIAGGWFYGEERIYREACAQYERQLAESGPAAMLAAWEELEAKKPRLAARPGMQTIRAKAEQQAAEEAANAAEFDLRIAVLEKLSADALAAPETGTRLQELQTLPAANDAARRKRFTDLAQKREAELKSRSQTAYAALVTRAVAWQKKLQENAKESRSAVRQQGFTTLAEELQTLTEQAQQEPIAPEKRDALLRALASQLQLQQKSSDRRLERQELARQLQNPDSFEAYCHALQAAAADPEYSRTFQNAIAAAPRWRELAALRLTPDSWESDGGTDRVTAFLPLLPDSHRTILAALLPEGKCNGVPLMQKFQEAVTAFEHSFRAPEYQVKVLALTGSDGLPCRLYTDQPVTMDKTGRRVKGVEFAVLTAPGGKSVTALFSVSGRRVFPAEEVVIDNFRMPSEYTLAGDADHFPENLPLAAHLPVLERIVGPLRHAATPQEALAALQEAFRQLAETPDLEPVIRRRMSAGLFRMAAILTPFAAPEIQKTIAALPADQPPFANWCDFSLVRREPEAWAQYQEQLTKTDGAALLERLRQYRKLLLRLVSRDLAPAGLLQKTADGNWTCHTFPVHGKPQELWLAVPGNADELFKIVGRITAGKLYLAPTAEPFFREGAVLWAPLTEPDSRTLRQELAQGGKEFQDLALWLPADLTADHGEEQP